MSGQSPTILIFGGEVGSRAESQNAPGSNRVPVETIKANLKTVMENVKSLVHVTQGGMGDLVVSHVDVGVAISIDGSVGLIGTGANTSPEATLRVRLRIGRSLKF
jgi:hypothetical protein